MKHHSCSGKIGLLIMVISASFACTSAVGSESTLPGSTNEFVGSNLKSDQRVSTWRTELESHIHDVLFINHYFLDSYAASQMQSAVEKASRDIEATPEEQRSAKLEEAKRNFSTFIEEMIRASSVLQGEKKMTKGKGGFHQTEEIISDQTFSSVRTKLCPIWPICKEAM